MIPADAFRPIADYALIGDCRTAALVSSTGSIDWMCWPRFDSPSLFAALLDPEKGGRWQIAPSGPYRTGRSYEASSNVLVTTFSSQTGRVRLTDLFFAASEKYKREHLLPQAMLIRRVECLAGRVEMTQEFEPRPQFGQAPAPMERRGPSTWAFRLRDGLAVLAATDELVRDGDSLRGSMTLAAGERRDFVLSYSEEAPAVHPPLLDLDALVQTTNRYWQAWAQQIHYDGPRKESVDRSALVLKLLTFAPSAAIIAAPTTSLPEKLGAGYNWDYRFCWLRDASYTVNALLGLGMREEGFAFLQWLLHATHLTRPKLQVVYSVLGKPALAEKELDHLRGYADSRPVRIGNAAHEQFQLDIYGEVINAASLCYGQGARLSGDEKVFLRRLADYIVENWQSPDSGIWETRGSTRHFVHSKVLAWVGLDRVLALARAGHIKVDAEKYAEAARQIAEQVKSRGYSPAVGSYAAAFDSDELDASVLRLPIVGFEDPSDPRMAATIEAVTRQLSTDGLVRRHGQAETGGEGAFLLCSFWLVQCLALQGKLAEALSLFDSLCERANDVGLFAEEIELESGAFLGNFPQAFTHIGLINAALSLQEAQAEARNMK